MATAKRTSKGRTTANKGRTASKRVTVKGKAVKGRQKGKRAVVKADGTREGWTINDYRDAHLRIPGKVYSTKGVSADKTINRKNHAPLGRPPEAYSNRIEYNRVKAMLTKSGRSADRKRKAIQKKKYGHVLKEVDDPELEYQRARDAWEDELASNNYGLNQRADEVLTELEDRGYSDYRSDWRRMSSKQKARALREKAFEDYKTYEDEWRYDY